MKIEGLPFSTIDWSKIEPTHHPGESGTATWRTIQAAGIRVRMVEYSPGYLADHWCSKGHVILVLEGVLTTELRDGQTVEMTAGQGYTVGDETAPHRSRTRSGAKLFIVD